MASLKHKPMLSSVLSTHSNNPAVEYATRVLETNVITGDEREIETAVRQLQRALMDTGVAINTAKCAAQYQRDKFYALDAQAISA